VAEVSKIGNLQERLVVVNHGWQSESTDGPKGGWSCVFWNELEWLQWLQWSPHPQLLDLSIYLSIHPSIYLSIYLSVYLQA